MNKELFDSSMKEARELLVPHIKYAEQGDDNLIIELAFIIFKNKLQNGN